MYIRLDVRSYNEYYINNKKDFTHNPVDKETLEKCFEFAYNMVFGDGHHRNHRSGGQYDRKKGELFANTFQGKLAEYATYIKLKNAGLVDLEHPDMGIYGKGVWDDTDLKYKHININIKSAAYFSNLLLLECKDWNEQGEYIPNIDSSSSKVYDFFLMIRVKPDIKALLRKNRLFYSDDISKSVLNKIITDENWYIDFGGYCTIQTIKYIINEKYILPQNSLLNGRTKMDANNFYIQCGDLKDIDDLIQNLLTV